MLKCEHPWLGDKCDLYMYSFFLCGCGLYLGGLNSPEIMVVSYVTNFLCKILNEEIQM